MFNSEAIKVRYIITIHIESYPMASSRYQSNLIDLSHQDLLHMPHPLL